MDKPRRRDLVAALLILLLSETIILLCIALPFGIKPGLALAAMITVCAICDIYLLVAWPHGGYVAVWARRQKRKLNKFLGFDTDGDDPDDH